MGTCCFLSEINKAVARILVFKMPPPSCLPQVCYTHYTFSPPPHRFFLPLESQLQATGHRLAYIKIRSITWNLHLSWDQSSLLGKRESAKFLSPIMWAEFVPGRFQHPIKLTLLHFVLKVGLGNTSNQRKFPKLYILLKREFRLL